MSSFGGWGVPGTGALAETTEAEILWGGDRAKGLVLEQNGNYSGTIRDAGNSPTTVIRPGLLVAKLDTGGELTEWNADTLLGAQNLWGVVPHEFRAQDFDATDADRVLGVIVQAPLKASALLIEGLAFVGHANEYLARRALNGMGCVLDDDPQGYLAGAGERQQATAADLTVTAAMNGTTFVGHTADNEFTLPTIKAGLKYTFCQSANFELKVTAAVAGTIIGANDASADAITFTTTGEQIGAQVTFEAMNVNGTVLWIYYQRIVNFSIDNFFAFTLTSA